MTRQQKQAHTDDRADSPSKLPPRFDQVRRFWQGPNVEQALLHADIMTTTAHVHMLAETGIVDKQVATEVLKALNQIASDLLDGKSPLSAEDPDIHVAVHRRLHELIGEKADVVRIAKSHNDQIATDIRLWLRGQTMEIFERLLSLRGDFIALAQRDIEAIMPGYTHMQPAMPILLSHWWLANEARFRRDFQRLQDVYKRLNVLPLGACQLAGTNYPIDRELVARFLNFDSVMENSLDAVCDRDYLIDFSSFASVLGLHISQMASELLLWSTQEYGFVRLPRAFVFRSQSMPQKRNAELLEILRSRPSLLSGRLMEFLSELKGLSLSFSQDLQECLPGLLDVVDNLKFILELAHVLLPVLKIDVERMREKAKSDLTNASNAVDFLVDRDMSVDKASKIVESIIAYCKERGRNLADLTMNEWSLFSPAFNHDIYEYVSLEHSVDSRDSFGGTSHEQVEQALNRAANTLESDRNSITKLSIER